jgi:hypothetical protein
MGGYGEGDNRVVRGFPKVTTGWVFFEECAGIYPWLSFSPVNERKKRPLSKEAVFFNPLKSRNYFASAVAFGSVLFLSTSSLPLSQEAKRANERMLKMVRRFFITSVSFCLV